MFSPDCTLCQRRPPRPEDGKGVAGAFAELMAIYSDPDAPVRICRGGETFPLFGRSVALLAATLRQDAAADTARETDAKEGS